MKNYFERIILKIDKIYILSCVNNFFIFSEIDFMDDGGITFVNDLPFVLYNSRVSYIQMLSTVLYDR